jgi:hypothetical protein
MNTKVRIGPIEKRVRELWEEGRFCVADDFLHKKLCRELLDKYIKATDANIDDAPSDEPVLKRWKAIDIRFAKMADKRKAKP